MTTSHSMSSSIMRLSVISWRWNGRVDSLFGTAERNARGTFGRWTEDRPVLVDHPNLAIAFRGLCQSAEGMTAGRAAVIGEDGKPQRRIGRTLLG
jgi:hypothetical protein